MIKFYHAPWSRSSATLWLLEELGIDYHMEVVDIRAEGGVDESYRMIQPNKKVPAVEIDGAVVTERAAIAVHLADRFPRAGLAPAVGEAMRGPYLTMLVYCDAVFDPCVSARAQGWDYAGSAFSFGAFEDMVAYLERVLAGRGYAAGDRFTAADTQIASALGFVMQHLGVLPEREIFRDYVARCQTRPAAQRAEAIDRDLAMETPYFERPRPS